MGGVLVLLWEPRKSCWTPPSTGAQPEEDIGEGLTLKTHAAITALPPGWRLPFSIQSHTYHLCLDYNVQGFVFLEEK